MPVPFELDTLQAYAEIAPPIVSPQIGSVEMLPNRNILSPNQLKLLTLEEASSGLSMTEQPRAFLENHNNRFAKLETDIKMAVDNLLPGFIGTFADHLQTIAPENDWHTVLSTRLNRIKSISVDDYLARDYAWQAVFLPNVNELHFLNHWGFIDNGMRDLSEIVLPHELIHIAAVRGIHRRGYQNGSAISHLAARSGAHLVLLPEDKPLENANDGIHYADWLDEAITENLRDKLFPSSTQQTGYVTSLSILRSLHDLDHGLEPALERLLFTADAPGPVFGKVEALLGPTIINDVEALRGRLALIPDPKDSLAAASIAMPGLSLPKSSRTAFLSAFQKHVELARPMPIS